MGKQDAWAPNWWQAKWEHLVKETGTRATGARAVTWPPVNNLLAWSVTWVPCPFKRQALPTPNQVPLPCRQVDLLLIYSTPAMAPVCSQNKGGPSLLFRFNLNSVVEIA